MRGQTHQRVLSVFAAHSEARRSQVRAVEEVVLLAAEARAPHAEGIEVGTDLIGSWRKTCQVFLFRGTGH